MKFIFKNNKRSHVKDIAISLVVFIAIITASLTYSQTAQASRMTLLPDAIGVTCPTHGWQIGRTVCQFCTFNPFKTRRSSSLAGLGVRPLSYSHEIAHDQFGHDGDALP